MGILLRPCMLLSTPLPPGLSAQMLFDISIWIKNGARLERDACSMNGQMAKASNE